MGAIYAVAGNPVLGSLSPAMWNAAFRDLSMDAVYTRMAASSGQDVTAMARAIGMGGLNVTSPFKEAVMPVLDDLDDRAREIGSVNTVVSGEGRLKGYNTDYAGVRDALTRNGVHSEGKRAVVLGAGGAGRAAVFALRSSCSEVTLVNRSFHKARDWAKTLGCEAAPMEDLNDVVRRADILISSITFPGRIVAPSSLRPDLVVFDANYSRETALREDARDACCGVIDGREWLLFQALPAFRLMTGLEPPEEAMREALYRGVRPGKTNLGLIGFMGTGKTTAGAGVAARRGMRAGDTDAAIAGLTGLTIPQVFARIKEDGFRALEEEEIRRVRDISHTVVSFGGGAVLRERNVDAIRQGCVAVWLWASPETILSRTKNDRTRPLLTGRDTLARIRAILDARIPLYARTADLIINTDGATPEETIERICHEIDMPL